MPRESVELIFKRLNSDLNTLKVMLVTAPSKSEDLDEFMMVMIASIDSWRESSFRPNSYLWNERMRLTKVIKELVCKWKALPEEPKEV